MRELGLSMRTRWVVLGMLASLLAVGSTWTQARADSAPPLCTAPAPDAPILITDHCTDPRFNAGYAFVDLDQVQQTPVPHRVVQGGFRGTDLRFVFYFPAADQYRGRFIQGPVHQLRLTGEVASKDEIQFAFASGAYLVETNNGGNDVCLTARDGASGRCDPTIVGYRAAAAAARFSRVMAQRIYGTHTRPYGYLYGGSGGAYMTLAGAENTEGIWDGFLPFVMGDPQALVAHFAIKDHALRVVGDKMADVVDAMDPGGSANPYATLDNDQAAALREATRLGYPLRGWWNYDEARHSTAGMITSDYVKLLDPTYVDDFWSKPGYLGTEPSPMGAAIRAARIVHNTKVMASAPVNAPGPAPTPPSPPYGATGPAYPYAMVAQYGTGLPPKAFVLESLPKGNLYNAYLVATSGPVSGQSCPLFVVNGDHNIVECGPNSDPAVINGIGVGDTVRIDNSFALAFQTQPRHEVAPTDFGVYSYDQYRSGDGSPIYPQRRVFPGVIGTKAGAGAVSRGRFHGKMIVMNTLLDQDAFPFPADWYRRKAIQAQGRRVVDHHLRIYFTDNAVHGGTASARTVSYGGILQQALRDLAAWTEHGTPPPPNTNYTVDRNTQVQVPARAGQRMGLQPVVDLTVNGSQRIDVKAGSTVQLQATVEAPPGTGKVICVEWSADGTSFNETNSPAGSLSPHDPGGTVGASSSQTCTVAPAPKVTATMAFSYPNPGTYFAVVRGTTQRDGDPSTPWTRVQNLARVRVVVH